MQKAITLAGWYDASCNGFIMNESNLARKNPRSKINNPRRLNDESATV